MLPLTFKTQGARVLVLGAGRIGVRKVRQFLDAGARVSVIAEEFRVALPSGVEQVHCRSYRSGDLKGYSLVVSALGRGDVNDDVVREAREENIWLNVVDDPLRSTFYFMALHRQGPITVAVSTEGAAPALAQEIRTMIEATLPHNLAHVASVLRQERQSLHDQGLSSEGLDWPARIRELVAFAPR